MRQPKSAAGSTPAASTRTARSTTYRRAPRRHRHRLTTRTADSTTCRHAPRRRPLWRQHHRLALSPAAASLTAHHKIMNPLQSLKSPGRSSVILCLRHLRTRSTSFSRSSTEKTRHHSDTLKHSMWARKVKRSSLGRQLFPQCLLAMKSQHRRPHCLRQQQPRQQEEQQVLMPRPSSRGCHKRCSNE